MSGNQLQILQNTKDQAANGMTFQPEGHMLESSHRQSTWQFTVGYGLPENDAPFGSTDKIRGNKVKLHCLSTLRNSLEGPLHSLTMHIHLSCYFNSVSVALSHFIQRDFLSS